MRKHKVVVRLTSKPDGQKGGGGECGYMLFCLYRNVPKCVFITLFARYEPHFESQPDHVI